MNWKVKHHSQRCLLFKLLLQPKIRRLKLAGTSGEKSLSAASSDRWDTKLTCRERSERTGSGQSDSIQGHRKTLRVTLTAVREAVSLYSPWG